MIPKFRAWEISGKRMVSVKSIDFVNRFIEYIHHPYSNPNRILSEILEFENIILMQSTGLKDKNGVEIFEGDVIECTHQNGTTFNGVVTYDEKNAFWGVTDQRYKELSAIPAFSGYLSQVATCEVIGNIYENELVEG